MMQIRDLQNNFNMNLSSSVPSYLERYGAASDNQELEALPEDVQLMLGDKDALMNALQVSLLDIWHVHSIDSNMWQTSCLSTLSCKFFRTQLTSVRLCFHVMSSQL